MESLKMSSKGIVVIPKEVRETHDLKKGSRFVLIDKGKTLVLVPIPKDPLMALKGIAKNERRMRSRLKELRAEWDKNLER